MDEERRLRWAKWDVWYWGGSFVAATQLVQPGLAPIKVASGVASVASGSSAFNHVCAVKIDGSVWCWGYNSVGQLGSGVPLFGTYACSWLTTTKTRGKCTWRSFVAPDSTSASPPTARKQ